MLNALFPWPRPRFVVGGANATVFYEIYGEFAGLQLQISRSRHNSNGLPASLESRLMDADLGVWNGVAGELLRESNEQAWDLAQNAPHKIQIRGEVSDPDSLDFLRDTIGVVAALLENGGAAVFDPQILSAWTAPQWREKFFEDAFEPTNHAVILVSPDENQSGKLWLHTRGMRLFGRPDVSCHGVLPTQTEPLQAVFNGLIRMQAAGALIPENQLVQAVGIENRLICQHRGDLDDADFNNSHLELGWETVGEI